MLKKSTLLMISALLLGSMESSQAFTVKYTATVIVSKEGMTELTEPYTKENLTRHFEQLLGLPTASFSIELNGKVIDNMSDEDFKRELVNATVIEITTRRK